MMCADRVCRHHVRGRCVTQPPLPSLSRSRGCCCCCCCARGHVARSPRIFGSSPLRVPPVPAPIAPAPPPPAPTRDIHPAPTYPRGLESPHRAAASFHLPPQQQDCVWSLPQGWSALVPVCGASTSRGLDWMRLCVSPRQINGIVSARALMSLSSRPAR
uniref:Uncharacterized protein n=1 Tax=Knipowitschia caucasica TaxID=637954 RepID=A0AAV2M0P3_KNICA